MQMQDFYNGKKVLITGHTGFKGTWLSFLLREMGAQLFGYSLPAAPEALYLRAHPEYKREVFADLRERKKLEDFICEIRPDIIFHLAAHSTLDGVLEIPYDIFEINTMGTAALMDCVRRLPYPACVVVVTSDKCYLQDGNEHIFQEEDPLGAADPYSSSKACQELVVQSFFKTFPGLQACTARASNTIGGGDCNSSRLLPYLLHCYSTAQPAQIRNPQFIRPWQYVLDVLYGYATLGYLMYTKPGDISRAYNFGPDVDGFQTVQALSDQLATLFSAPRALVQPVQQVQEAPLLKLCSDRAKQELGWRPRFTFLETLNEIVEFVHQEQATSARDACYAAVQRYLKRLEGDEKLS